MGYKKKNGGGGGVEILFCSSSEGVCVVGANTGQEGGRFLFFCMKMEKRKKIVKLLMQAPPTDTQLDENISTLRPTTEDVKKKDKYDLKIQSSLKQYVPQIHVLTVSKVVGVNTYSPSSFSVSSFRSNGGKKCPQF